MAEKRMFAKSIVLSDAFLDMPMSARCLYFTLGMFGDDDGFVNNPRSIMRQCGATEDDMKLLIVKKFVLIFESGVIVIKHWRINNYLRNDRYVETKYKNEKSTLSINEIGAYEKNEDEMVLGIPCSTTGIPSGQPNITEHNITKHNNNIYSSVSDETEPSIYEQIIGYLNQQAGTLYRFSSRKSRSLIDSRIREKYTIDDFKTVIDKKVAEWKGSDMERYLRPETLFGSKFEGYLNQKIVKSESKQTKRANAFIDIMEHDDWDYEELERMSSRRIE